MIRPGGMGTLRKEQHATRAAFFMPGFAVAIWAPLVPYAKQNAGLDEAQLGLVLLCIGAGSLTAMPLAGMLTARMGCRWVMVLGTVLMCMALPALALIGDAVGLGLALVLFGAGVGAMDCAMNMQAVAVERDSARPLMSGFHAFYSVGGFCGAGFMTLLLSAGIASTVAAFAGTGIVVAFALLSASRWRADPMRHDGPLFAIPKGIVALIGALAFVVFLAEGAMMDWSAVFLSEVRQVPSANAGTGFLVFSLAMTAMRLVGDRLVQRLGRLRVVSTGALCAAVGLSLSLLSSAPSASLIGFALVGMGCANIVPVLFTLAGKQKTMPEHIAIPAITTMGYAGVLAGPAGIGFVAHATSLPIAFAVVAVSLLCVAACALLLRTIETSA